LEDEGERMKTNVVFLLLVLGAAQTPKAAAQSPGTFTATGNLTTARVHHTATLLTNGKVLITGGQNDDGRGILASAELFDPATGTFSVTGQMTSPRSGHTATLLADGRVLTAGGGNADLYDPATGTFSATGNMTTVRSGHTATLLADGRVLIAGGGTAELYDPATGTFTAAGTIPTVRSGTATLLADGTVLIGTELYHPSTGTYANTGDPTDHDYAYTATLLLDGTVLIGGGGDSDPGNCLANAELYNPVLGTFAAVPSMTICRFSHTATLLPDGRVLIVGGASYGVGPYQANLNEFELYNPSAGTFSASGPMIVGRQLHTATLLLDGRVLIAGGVGAPRYSTLASAEIYNPLSAPVLFSLSGDGRGQGAIQHVSTYQFASADNPAVAGEVLAIYWAGLVEGSVIPPQVAIGGRTAGVLWFGDTPGSARLNQVNVRVPSGVAPGSAVPVRLTYLGRPSNEVTIGVR
jgi:galactose oxidase-like protein